MFQSTIISRLVQGIRPVHQEALWLRPGQVLLGEVKQLFPNQRALVQFESMTVAAKLEAPLSVGQKTWFQVLPGSSPITLKTITLPSQQETTEAGLLKMLLRSFGLSQGKEEESLLRFFVQEKLPVDRTALQQSRQIVRELGQTATMLKALQIAVVRGWPITTTIIQAIHSFLFEPPLTQQMQELLPMLAPTQQSKLQSYLPVIQEKEAANPNLLRQFFTMLGLEHESRLEQQLRVGELDLFWREGAQHNLKGQLHQLLGQSFLSPAAQEKVERMLSHITGQQIFLNLDNGAQQPVSHLLFQVALSLGQESSTLYGQLESRKNSQGQLDADNCRLLFYVHLHTLREVCIDVHITQRIVSLTIHNHLPKVQGWLQELKPSISAAFSQWGYTLSSLLWKQAIPASTSTEQGTSGHGVGRSLVTEYEQRYYQGVDIRI